MFTLSEIKNVGRKYQLNNKGEIVLTGKDEGKTPSKMTDEESSYIESALFLNLMVTIKKLSSFAMFQNLSDEKYLEQIQIQFTKELLSSNEYKYTDTEFGTSISQIIWLLMADEYAPAVKYRDRVLAENGKELQILTIYGDSAKEMHIKYDLKDNSKNKVSNIFTSTRGVNAVTEILTPEQKERRRQLVEKAMHLYKQCETDENYEERVKKETSDMRLVFDLVHNSGDFLFLNSVPRIMDLLYAAQNISLNGQIDYLEEVISRPKISKFVFGMERNKTLDQMYKKAEKRKADGTIHEHKSTHGEISFKRANEFIDEHPNAVKRAREELNKRSTFTVKKGDNEALKKARLIELCAMLSGNTTTRTTDKEGNRILQIDNSSITGENNSSKGK